MVGSAPSASVTVCIPTVGRPSLRQRTLPSILAARTAGTEAVVVGDVEHDEVTGVLPGAIVLADDDAGQASSEAPTAARRRNRALQAATGDLVVFLDDDDELTPGALVTLATAFDTATVGFASGAARAIAPDGSEIEVVAPQPLGPLYGDLHGVHLAGAFAVRRELLLAVGGYHEELRFGENADLVMRIGQELRRRDLRAVALDQVVVHHHRSGRAYRADVGAAAEHVLTCQADVLARHRHLRAQHHGIAGVSAFRHGDPADARRHLGRAVRDAPTSPAAWGRLLLSLAPPIARWRWARGRP